MWYLKMYRTDFWIRFGRTVVALVALLILVLAGFILWDFALPNHRLFDPERASSFGAFWGGLFAPILSFVSITMLWFSFKVQSIERAKDRVREQFFKMIEYHNHRVDRLRVYPLRTREAMTKLRPKAKALHGEYAFAEYRRQIATLFRLLQGFQGDGYFTREDNVQYRHLFDTAYVLFYYGVDAEAKQTTSERLRYILPERRADFVAELMQRLPYEALPSHRTVLSAYFRNMYNAICLVDRCSVFSPEEKQELVSIYRAQWSDPELYVLCFNWASRFGLRWQEAQFIERYALLANFPHPQIEGISTKLLFDIAYEYEDYMTDF